MNVYVFYGNGRSWHFKCTARNNVQKIQLQTSALSLKSGKFYYYAV